MNWDAIGAIGEILGAVAVLVTLIYLARQIRYAGQATTLSSFQHTHDAFNWFSDSIAGSEEVASLVHRGRASFLELTEVDQLRFEFIYGRALNIIESWHFQVLQTATPGPYRAEQLRNIAAVVRWNCDYPGVLQLWEERLQTLYSPETRELIRENTGTVRK